MSNLLLRPRDTAAGVVHDVTPQSAGWTYVGFKLIRIAAGEMVEGTTGDRETCLVLVSGKAKVVAEGTDFGLIGERMNPFDGLPWSVYVPGGTDWSVTADTAVELAVCTAPAGNGGLKARLIHPQDVGEETRGTGTNTRRVRAILFETAPADSLLVVEVITPGGHWSSYPPHKHDVDNLPEESLLEETYYHRIRPPQGFAVQRVYTEDRSLDETVLVSDGDVVLVPKGHHPVGAAHGYDLYYLNVMAGPTRAWKFRNDPDHDWLMQR